MIPTILIGFIMLKVGMHPILWVAYFAHLIAKVYLVIMKGNEKTV